VCHIQQAIAPRAPAILLVLAAATKDPTATPLPPSTPARADRDLLRRQPRAPPFARCPGRSARPVPTVGAQPFLRKGLAQLAAGGRLFPAAGRAATWSACSPPRRGRTPPYPADFRPRHLEPTEIAGHRASPLLYSPCTGRPIDLVGTGTRARVTARVAISSLQWRGRKSAGRGSPSAPWGAEARRSRSRRDRRQGKSRPRRSWARPFRRNGCAPTVVRACGPAGQRAKAGPAG